MNYIVSILTKHIGFVYDEVIIKKNMQMHESRCSNYNFKASDSSDFRFVCIEILRKILYIEYEIKYVYCVISKSSVK